MNTTKSRRVMIIGMDGATLDLIAPWAEEGILPNFKKLMQSGAHGLLRTIDPPITPTAWSSFLTGVNPGKHGLFDFTGHKKDSYDTYVVNAHHRFGASLWKLLSDAGRQVVVFNVPLTYPVEKVNGAMISGLLTPASAKDASWPPELQKEVEDAVPEFNFAPPGMYSRGRDLQFVQDVRSLNRTTLQVAHYLMDRKPWDFFCTIFMGTDIMSHFMWRNMDTGAADAPESIRPTLANAIKDCYRDMDNALGELMAHAGPDTNIVVMSDHGFGKMDKYISVNAWLVERGYIRFKRNPLSQLRYLLYRLGFTPLRVYGLLRRLGFGDMMRGEVRKNSGIMQEINSKFFLSFRDVDWTRTRAYSNGYAGPIFVNLKGREPQGIVAPGAEYDRVLAEIIADLRSIKEPDTGLPFVGEIHRGSDVYHGEHMEQAPDLLFFARDWKYAGLGLVEFPTNAWLADSPDRSGHHRMDGILFLSGPGIRSGYRIQGASIMDVAPTVLALLGAPIPDNMDGRVLQAAMTDELRSQLAIRYVHGDGQSEQGIPIAIPELSEEDEEIIRSRLANLGYIDS